MNKFVIQIALYQGGDSKKLLAPPLRLFIEIYLLLYFLLKYIKIYKDNLLFLYKKQSTLKAVFVC